MKIDEIGSRHEQLTVIAESDPVNSNAMWLCKCDCGNETIVRGSNLRSGGTKSCGCLTTKINELGNKYKFLTVIAKAKSVNNKSMWLCKCDCGNMVTVRSASLRSGNTKSCGCIKKKDEIGNRYERLAIIAEAEMVNGIAMWLCKCGCGNETIVSGRNLRYGGTKSCGCWGIDKSSAQRGNKNHAYIHGRDCGFGTKEQREFHEHIRERDNYTCRECGKTQEQELTEAGQRLSVHHKDGDHFHNVDENAVTLCECCHSGIHGELAKIQAEKDYWDMMYRIEQEANNERE